MPNPLTDADLKLARGLRQQGTSWQRVAKALGRKTDFVRKCLDIRFRERRTGYAQNYVPGQRVTPHRGQWPEERQRIPDDVLADRDRRAQIEPASITAALMGDPPVGRSALDKRKPRLVVTNE